MKCSPFSRTRNKQVRRAIQIVALMQRGYWSYDKLATRFGVSKRTIMRDFAALRFDNVRLKHDGIQSCWSLK